MKSCCFKNCLQYATAEGQQLKKAAERPSLPLNSALNSSFKERCLPFTQIDLGYERRSFNQSTTLGAQPWLVHITACIITTLPQLVREAPKRLLRKLLNRRPQ